MPEADRGGETLAGGGEINSAHAPIVQVTSIPVEPSTRGSANAIF
jgi:hypothetical protein